MIIASLFGFINLYLLVRSDDVQVWTKVRVRSAYDFAKKNIDSQTGKIKPGGELPAFKRFIDSGSACNRHAH